MLSKQNILIFALVTVIPTVIGILYIPYHFILFLIEIPVFAASFLVLSFLIKSNKIKIMISVSVALTIQLWTWGSTIARGGFS